MSLLEALWGRALAEGRLAHAYLLVGEGAAAVAREFLLHLYCERSCHKCPACEKILHGTHPDVQWLKKEGKWFSIDQIRQLQRDARYPPLEGSRKVYVLEGAEDLSLEAANSLLRILESPPEYVMFLLLARSLRLLPTILSRCQIIRLKPLSRSQILEALKSQLPSASKPEMEYALALVQGFPQRLSGLLASQWPKGGLLEHKSQVLAQLRELTAQQLAEFLAQSEGLLEQREASVELLKHLPHQRPHEILDIAQVLSRMDQDKLYFFLQEALRWYRDLALMDHEEALVFNRDRMSELREQRAYLSPIQLNQAIESLEGVQEALQGNANVQLLVESLLFTLAGEAPRPAAG